jgi:quercetin dioxygenase-like cupin family protein
MYEEIMVVVEGRGTTEIWLDGQTKPHTFEWQRGSMFSIPLNTNHRIINAASSPALILVATTAPNVMNIFRDTDWIFNCPVAFPSRFNGSQDFFKPNDDIVPDPLRGLALRKSNFIPDIMNADLYLDNRRSPGYKRVEPHMANNVFYGFVGEHKTGRYSKAHAHMSAAILVCLKGKGYTYTWPRTDGMTPWQDGKTKNIYRQDYEPVGLVTAAPYGGDWFHAHFGISKEPLRLIGWYGPNNHRKDKAGVPGEKDTDEGAIDVTEGGTAIPYWLEDPFLRKEYEETLKKEGVTSQMGEELFCAPTGNSEKAIA